VVSGNAADMAVKAAPLPMAAVFSWTGFYIGGNVGGAWSRNNGDSDFGPLFPCIESLPGGGDTSGVIGGGQIGYNWQVNQFVLGVEADVVGSGLKGSSASLSRTFGPPVILAPVTQTVTV
jgi:outer membrane immunogenic protein